MSNILIYSFYNNKGGVGKTTLCQNAASLYAENNPKKQVLVIDLCPQANVSQFFLGGGHIGEKENQKIQSSHSRRNIVGFIDWILKGNSGFTNTRGSYAINASHYNKNIPGNLYLIPGDSFLESLSLALNYAVLNPANINAWHEYMTAIRRLCELEFKFQEKYESLTVFIDCNPSFSIYTQMGLVSSDFILVPMMADFSSLEGIRGILMLLYGKYQSSAEKKYADTIITFNRKIKESDIVLPKFYEFIFNNFTSNQGVANAFNSIKKQLIDFCFSQYNTSIDLFATTENAVENKQEFESAFVSDIKDFHTAGKISSTLGIPLYKLDQKNKYTMPDGQNIILSPASYQPALEQIENFTKKLA